MSSKTAWRSYLVVLHIAVLLGALRTAPAVDFATALGIEHPSVTRNLQRIRATHHLKDESAPAGASIFLGDSHTLMLSAAAVASNPVNFGVSGQSARQLLAAMDDYHSLSRAGRVFIMTGTNELRWGREDELLETYRQILAKVPRGVPVIMSSVPPMTGKPEQSALAARSAQLACRADQRCQFVDVQSALLGPGLIGDDGVHLTAKGYAQLIAKLKGAVTSPSPGRLPLPTSP